MSIEAHFRAVDAGGPVVIHEQDPPPACGHGVCVETVFDDTHSEIDIALSLRRTTRHDGGPAHVDATRAAIRVSLTTGLCTRSDAEADLLFAEHPWLLTELVARLDWLRARASRHAAQRDRTTLFGAVQRANPGDMLPYNKLFPADWDLLVTHAGTIYWAVDYYCIKPACDCHHVHVALHDVATPDAPLIGTLQIDLARSPPATKASSSLAKTILEPLWSKYDATLFARYGDLRKALSATAERRPAHVAASPPRNAPCRCGSGKKYKRCCLDRDLSSARAGR